MQKRVGIEIREDMDYLKRLRKQESNHRLKTRIQSLILTKENKFSRRLDLANYLGIGITSLDRWTKVYKESRLDSMLTIFNAGKRSMKVLQKRYMISLVSTIN